MNTSFDTSSPILVTRPDSSTNKSNASHSSSDASNFESAINHATNDSSTQGNADASVKPKKTDHDGHSDSSSATDSSSSPSQDGTTVANQGTSDAKDKSKSADASIPIYFVAGQVMTQQQVIPQQPLSPQNPAQPSTTDANAATAVTSAVLAAATSGAENAAVAGDVVAGADGAASETLTLDAKLPGNTSIDGEKDTTSADPTANNIPPGTDVTILKKITSEWAKTIQSNLYPSGTLDANTSTLMSSLPIHIDAFNGKKDSSGTATPDTLNGLTGVQMASASTLSALGTRSTTASQATTTTVPAQSVHDVTQIVTKELNSPDLAMPKRIEIPLQTPRGANVTLYLQDVQGQVRAQFSTNDHSALQWIDQQIPTLKQQQFATNVRWLPPQMDGQNPFQQQNQNSGRDSQRENNQMQETESADVFVSAMKKVSYA